MRPSYRKGGTHSHREKPNRWVAGVCFCVCHGALIRTGKAIRAFDTDETITGPAPSGDASKRVVRFLPDRYV